MAVSLVFTAHRWLYHSPVFVEDEEAGSNVRLMVLPDAAASDSPERSSDPEGLPIWSPPHPARWIVSKRVIEE